MEALKSADWDVLAERSARLDWAGNPRFHLDDWSEDRLERVTQALQYFEWDIGVAVLLTIRKFLHSQDAQRRGLKLIDVLPPVKAAGYADVITALGKVRLRTPDMEHAFLGDRVDSWLGVRRDVPAGKNGNNLLDVIINKSEIIMNSGNRRVAEPRSFEDFVAERSWLRTGATSWEAMIPRGYDRTKNSVGLTNTTAELLSRFEQDIRRGYAIWTIIPKIEPIQPRAVVKADDSSYLFFSWCTHYLFPWLSGSPYLHQAKNSDQKFTFWRECQWHIGRGVAFDADCSKWDESILKVVVLTICDTLVEKAARLGGGKYGMRAMWHRVRGYLDRAIITSLSEDGLVEIKWENGLPSGILWTWLINAWVNIALALQRQEDSGLQAIITTAQGDDLHEVFPPGTTLDMEWMLEWYASYGFNLHPQKSKISTDTGGEFLKMEITKKSVAGSKWRMMRSILWGQTDVGEMPIGGPLGAMMERASLWLKYELRGGDLSEDDVVRDFYGAARRRISKKIIRTMLRISTTFGGFGLFGELTNQRVKWTEDKPSLEPVYIYLSPTKKYARSIAWKRGMRALLRGARTRGEVQEGASRPKLVNNSVGYVKEGRFTLFASTLSRWLPPRSFVTPRIFTRAKGESKFDALTALDGLKQRETHPDATMNMTLSYWRGVTSATMWPKVLEARGYPLPGMSPKFARTFGEELANVSWQHLAGIVCAAIMRSRIDVRTFDNASLLAGDILPGWGWHLARI